MLKKRWLNVVCVLSACHPCLSGDVWRCQRWPGRRLFCIALHGGVLIESGHSPSSGGYMHDAVPSDRTMVEHDTRSESVILGVASAFGPDLYIYTLYHSGV